MHLHAPGDQSKMTRGAPPRLDRATATQSGVELWLFKSSVTPPLAVNGKLLKPGIVARGGARRAGYHACGTRTNAA